MINAEQLGHRLLVVTGHYGCGKTTLAVNLALDLARHGKQTSLVDMDIVNPYFRSADNERELSEAGVRLIAPVYANTNVDIPALPPDVQSVFAQRDTVSVLDVGGDDSGAAALGQYKRYFDEDDYLMLYAISTRRPLTATADDALALMHDIENMSRLKVGGIVNLTNLGRETTAETVLSSHSVALELAEKAGLPLMLTGAVTPIAEELERRGMENIYPLEMVTRTIF